MSKRSHLVARAGLAATALALAAPVLAQTAAAMDAPQTVLPLAQRLTLAGVVTHAKPLVELVFAGLVVAIAYAAFVYVRGVMARRDGRVEGLVFLSALAGGGPLIGLFGAAYGLLDMCIGIANVRPTPSLTVLAPGFAEAGLSVALGLLAGAVAVIGHRHLTGRGRAADAPASSTAAADAPPAHLARVIG